MKNASFVLIDSDDEAGTAKRQKVEQASSIPKLTRGFGTSNGLLQSDEDQVVGNESGSESDSESPSTSVYPSINEGEQKEDDEEDLHNDDDEEEGYTNANNVKNGGNEDDELFDNDENDSERDEHDDNGYLSSDLEHVTVADLDNIPPETIIETRKYLKQHGNMRFLEKFLPTAASGEDIVKLILKLGFVPKNLPEPDNANIMVLIKFLNYAMIKVSSIRTRLDTVKSFEDVLEQIHKASKILVITGAGISTSLGIPDFRSSKGFYSQVQHLGLSDPQEVFDLQIFLTDPSLFYSIAHMILPPGKIYSPLHSFILVLQSKGKLLRNYTQNIDNLESYAGIMPEKLIQCHGSFATATCVTCKYHVNGEEIFEDIKEKRVPLCPKCSKTREKLMQNDEDSYLPDSYGVLKPDITFFGEPLPDTFHDLIRKDLSECDLLISVGTSLKVAPVADIVDKIPEHVPQILINKDPIDHCNFDVSLLGYCDEVASYIASKLGEGWEIPHKDYKSIVGDNEPNLELRFVDEEYREYEIGRPGEKEENEEEEAEKGEIEGEDVKKEEVVEEIDIKPEEDASTATQWFDKPAREI